MNKLIQLFLFVLLIIYCYTSSDSECLSSANSRRLSSDCSELSTTDDEIFECVQNTNLNICEEVSKCKASSMGLTTGRRLSSQCSDLPTKKDNFVCVNDGDYCQEVSVCKASSYQTNGRRLSSDCSKLKTEDEGIFQCMGEDYCEEVLKPCEQIYFDENSFYLEMMEDVCAEAETSDDKKYECVVGPDKRKCQEQKLNKNFIKISKFIGLFVLLLI